LAVGSWQLARRTLIKGYKKYDVRYRIDDGGLEKMRLLVYNRAKDVYEGTKDIRNTMYDRG
jgi:hypothetical protein